MCYEPGVDIKAIRNVLEVFADKLARNALKYPVEKVKGSAAKYTEYET